jgi:dinuclear metal center YbgI/SA1388 family protein
MNGKNTKMTSVRQVWQIMDELAPPDLAAVWDTIGLQVGNPDQAVSKILLTLDVSEDVLALAAATGADLILAHHPLIFSPLPAVRQDVPEQRLVLQLCAARMSLLVAHTNLDATPGGVADCLADALGLSLIDRVPVGMYGRHGDMAETILLSRLLVMVKTALGSAGCRINTDQDRFVQRLAVFPGSFSEEDIPLLAPAGVEALVCGEMKHHVGQMLAARGICSIDAGHDVTERVVLQPLAVRLADRLPQISIAVWHGMDYNKMAF